jgi:hypothetical protein
MIRSLLYSHLTHQTTHFKQVNFAGELFLKKAMGWGRHSLWEQEDRLEGTKLGEAVVLEIRQGGQSTPVWRQGTGLGRIRSPA